MRNSAMRKIWIPALALLAACGPAKVAEKPKPPVPAPEQFSVRFETSKGDIVVAVNRAWAPLGADRFYELVQEKFYDEQKFFRVVRGFVAQWGIHKDPKTNRLWAGREIVDDPVKQSNLRGTLTFATRGPNTRSTQLFFNLRDNAALDRDGFAPIGKVTEGLAVLDQLAFVYGDIAPLGPGPDPKLAQQEGNAYFERTWPRLDTIKKVTVVR
jgi:peptidyl-prolyl cis-trans isomerase A (cyclophilin A)